MSLTLCLGTPVGNGEGAGVTIGQLGSSNVECTNNLIMESKRTHNGGVGVGALQGCEPDSE